MEFWRWLLANKPVVFGSFLEREPKVKFPYIITKTNLLTLIEKDQSVAGKFKRLSDGVLFSNVEMETEETPLYVHINLGAKAFTSRIQEAMIVSEMDEEFVVIELLPNEI